MTKIALGVTEFANSRRAVIAVAVAAVVATVGIIVWGTQPLGPGLYGDGAGYLSAAESLVRSGHLRVAGAPYWSSDSVTPMRQWPPGFAIAIAAPLKAGFGVMSAVALVQMIAAALTAVVTVLLVARVLSAPWGAVAAAAVLMTPAVLGTDLNIVSEPLYIAFVALLWAAMTWSSDRPLLSGSLAAAMVMIRYLGVGALVAVGVWALLQRATPAQRIRRGLVALAPGVATYAAWSLAVRHGGGTVTTGAFDHQVGPILRAFVGSIGAWLAPWTDGSSALRVAAKVWIVTVAACAALLAILTRRGREASSFSTPADRSIDSTRARLLLAGAVLATCHLIVLLAARVVTASVEFSPRTFAPVHYLLTVTGVVALGIGWSTSRRVGGLALAAGVVWFVGVTAASAKLLHEARFIGLDHARAEERSSPTIAWLRTHAVAVPIYTNEPAKIYFQLRRTARSLPWIVTSDTLRHLSEVLSQRPGYVVWFSGGQPSAYVPRPLLDKAISLDKLKLGARLDDVAHLSDGDIMVQDTAISKAASLLSDTKGGLTPVVELPRAPRG